MKPIEEFENIPGVRMRRLADKYRDLKKRIATLTTEAEDIREEVVGMLGLGKYDSCTVYEVGETKVSGYTRGAYKAIRARTRYVTNGH